jgi:UDP-N-acetyl-D-mannosaminuronic acid dehydrogenase
MTYNHDICVVGGAGHIGFPLALVFAAKGLDVAIYDINEAALGVIARGEVPFMEDGATELLGAALSQGNLTLSKDAVVVSKSKTVVVTVGTAVDEFLNPVFRDIRACFEDLLPHLAPVQLVVLRSTVYPGTTDWLHRWAASCGLQARISFCPERVVQGKAIAEVQSLPQIVSGTTPEAEVAAESFFSQIDVETVRMTPIEAEFAKLFSNAYRYISFAMANQFYMIATSAGVDYDRVMKGVKYHYPRLAGLSSAGFAAGPCLFKDTMQLNSFAKNQFFLGQGAMNVNEGLVLFIIDRLSLKYELQTMTIGLLGMAYKADNDDVRSSLSYKMKKVLQFRAKAVLTTDPYVKGDRDLSPLGDVLRNSDLLILCAPHKQYEKIDTGDTPLVDVWGFWGRGTLV